MREAREKFCGGHSNFSTDCTCKGGLGLETKAINTNQ